MGFNLNDFLSDTQKYVSAADAALTDYTGKDTAAATTKTTSDKTPLYIAGGLLLVLGVGLWAANR